MSNNSKLYKSLVRGLNEAIEDANGKKRLAQKTLVSIPVDFEKNIEPVDAKQNTRRKQ